MTTLPRPAAHWYARARSRAAHELRSRVAGPDAQERAAQIWQAPGPRWFVPDDPIWRVHAEAAMFAGGVRALLLQSLHPLAMAGVDQHSGYRTDPWGRLQNTSRFLATTTFGTISDAERLLARIRGIHRRVHGVAPDGRAYRADDPHLLMWVHVAEADSFLATHQHFARRPLTPAEADTYVAQIGTVAARLGVVDPPRTVAQLDERLASFRPELAATEASREAARFVLAMPSLGPAARPGYRLLVAGAVGTLPGWALDLLELPHRGGPVRRALGHVGVAGVRWMMSDPQVVADRSAPA